MKNRYTNLLEKENLKIIELSPANQTLRIILTYELEKFSDKNTKILEIGCGEGDSTLPVLEKTDLRLDLIDSSREMIEKCRKRLSKYKDRVNYVCEDAESFLFRSEPYDIITSSWTIHNFKQEDKQKLFSAIFEKLTKNGILLVMDKIFPDFNIEKVQESQLKRYNYLDQGVRKILLDHEEEDYSNNYRMDESKVINDLKKIGFKEIKILDRIGRDVILIARKGEHKRIQF